MHINASEARRIFIVASCHTLVWLTPSPVPRRLMKAPARATLSPKGERAEMIRTPLCPGASTGERAEKSIPAPLSPLGERGRGVRGSNKRPSMTRLLLLDSSTSQLFSSLPQIRQGVRQVPDGGIKVAIHLVIAVISFDVFRQGRHALFHLYGFCRCLRNARVGLSSDACEQGSAEGGAFRGSEGHELGAKYIRLDFSPSEVARAAAGGARSARPEFSAP